MSSGLGAEKLGGRGAEGLKAVVVLNAAPCSTMTRPGV